MTKKNNPSSYNFLIVFIAGFSFLIFEISWFRMLSLLLGATVSASTIVLAVFMAGIGIGAFVWSNRESNSARASRMLAILFSTIGLFGAVSPFLFGIFLPSLFSGTNPILVYLLTILFLFVPAFFMGGLLPLAALLLVTSKESLAYDLGKMYAFETAGSTLGGLMSGFVLIGSLGQNNSLFLAAFLNFALALFLLLNKKTEQYASEINASTAKAEQRTLKSEFPSKNKKIIAILLAFLTGFIVVGLQVVWIRIFKVYMTNTSYTFALIASMVILGLFIGSRIYAGLSKKSKPFIPNIPRLLIYMGISVFAGFIILLNLHSLVFFPLATQQEIHWIRIFLIPFISSTLIILPVAMFSGFAFPLACTLYTSDINKIHHHVGIILLSNTAGSVIGPLIAAFILIPLFGAALSIVALLALLLFVTLYILSLNKLVKSKNTFFSLVLIASIILVVVLIVKPKIYILPPSFNKFGKEILAYNESVEGTFVVGKENQSQNTSLSTYVNNSAVIGSSYDAIKAVKMVGHIPFFAGLKCKNALVVGFGIGVTTSAIASHPEVESIECVELIKGLKNTSHFYSTLNHNIADDKRLKVISGDGRHYLLTTTKKYDLISSDPTHPILGSGSLYTREYFELCRQHLNPGGMVSEYLPMHKLMLNDLLGIIKTFNSVFPEATVWIGHYHLILIGSNEPIKIDFETWKQNIASSEKDPYFYTNPYHVAACLLLDKTDISKFPTHIKINTDNHSYVEFFNLHSFDSQNLTMNLNYLNSMRSKPNRVFVNISDSLMMQKFVEGNIQLTLGLHEMLKSNNKGFLNYLQNACAVNPEDEEYPFLIKLHFN